MPSIKSRPSLLTIHGPPSSLQTQQPEPTLRLSLSLAQSIHSLILTSREIASIEHEKSPGNLSDLETAMRMGQLEAQVETLRKNVESELETAWVNAGLLQSVNDMSALSLKNPTMCSDKESETEDHPIDAYPEYTIDKELHRQNVLEETQSTPTYQKEGHKKRRLKSDKKSTNGNGPSSSTSSCDGDKGNGDGQFPHQIHPVGVRQAQIPLSYAHRERMRMFRWRKGKKRTWDDEPNVSEGLLSPLGSRFVY